MKKLFSVLLALTLVLSGVAMAESLSVIATPSPHGEILEMITDDLKALGYELELTIVTDYATHHS